MSEKLLILPTVPYFTKFSTKLPVGSVYKHFSVHVNLVEKTWAVVIWLSSIWKYNYISRSNFFNRSPKKTDGREKREEEKGNEVAIFFLFSNSPRVQIHHLSPMLVPLILQHSGPEKLCWTTNIIHFKINFGVFQKNCPF